ncbi:MAG: hypothetical protein M1812_003538 [Candelaria pacifica]|nr:MAG: hypothetical protein M1812_003538 [Candelaria pacifica]
MPSVLVPKDGLLLHDATAAGDSSSKPSSRPNQAMRLDLAADTLNEILKSARGGGKGVQLSFGKAMTLHYGSSSQALLSTPETVKHELYQPIQSESTRGLSISGVVSHMLQVKKVEETIGGTDAGLLALQSKMAALAKEKQSRKTLLVADSTQLPPAKSGKRPPAKTANSSGLSKLNHSRLLIGTTRSLPTSPALGASRPHEAALPPPPTSAFISQGHVPAKRQALRVPLIHLLAIRPASEKLLSQQTHCSKDDCLEVLQKVGRTSRSSASWELADRAYKDLDVWKFSYPSQDDRQAAIDNAVSAFDRLRVSREDKLWQMLLPKGERGQGKIISKLHLHAGPIQRSGTPNIQIRRTEGAPPGGSVPGAAEDESVDPKRLAPEMSEPMNRSKSQDQITKKKVSEKEALSKRLLSKNPKKAGRAPVRTKDSKVSDRSTPAKIDGKANGKIKSAEFVNESDVDVAMEGSLPEQSASSQRLDTISSLRSEAKPRDGPAKAPVKPMKASTQVIEGKPKHKPVTQELKSPESERSPVSSSKLPASPRYSNTSQSSSLSRPAASDYTRSRTTSSPQKPSPLGSSPPTNASDFENETGSYNAASSSSSPTISQTQRETPTPNGTAYPGMTSSNTSERSLKRKADDIDSTIHSHDLSSNKRYRNNSAAGISSDSSDSASPISTHQTLVLAQRFKKYYAQYEKMHRELSQLSDPPADRVRKITDMHNRLVSMKADIAKAAAVAT